jgi:unsaturated rhamnogalacturonyl hydrolase
MIIRFFRRRTLVLTFITACLLANCLSPTFASEQPDALVRQVADAVIRDNPEPPDFNWGEGILLAGMMQAHSMTGEAKYLEFVRRFADHWSQAGIEPLLEKKGYCGHWGPGYPLWQLYEETHDARYAAMVHQIIRFMSERAERTTDGGLSHFNGKPQLWVDTLAMCCPVLSTGSRIDKSDALQAESVRQLRIFTTHLRDPQTGLYYHMWDQTSGSRTPSFWARGNGWVVLSLVETLRYEPSASPSRDELRGLLQRQLASIAKLQDASTGLWHTVLDAPDTYLETSASALFLYGMQESRALELDTGIPLETLQRAWRGLATQVDPQGRVIGVSGGTGPSDQRGYAAKIHGTYPWGTGAFLMAAAVWGKSVGEEQRGSAGK